MTGRARAARASAMFRHAWLLLLCFLASSLVLTATLHAQESYGVAEIDCVTPSHVDGNAGQASADGDQPVPHHHGTCHGHNLTAPVTSPALLPTMTARGTPSASAISHLLDRMIGPALEPPRG